MTLRMPTHVLMRFLVGAHKGDFLGVNDTPCLSIRAAIPFYSNEEAWEYVTKTGIGAAWFCSSLCAGDAISIIKHHLRFRAKQLFGLKANSPIWLIADRYEEEGMQEEADFLRTGVFPGGK